MIIPTLNEAGLIRKTLDGLPAYENLERIVVDGGSSDDTVPSAKRSADQVLVAGAGRARQMNAGARAANGEILHFLHADSILPAGAFHEMAKAMKDPAVVGGAFRLAIDSARVSLKLVAAVANWRTGISRIPYGDQGIFIRRRAFDELGGFPDLPIMEDLEMARRLRRKGRMVFLRQAIITSSRRWDREGVWNTTVRNQVFVLLYFLGVSPVRLARWYRPVR